ncbi:hypothetical protein FB99_13990 [Pantoea agglomerans]|nr:hypothetical protein FB99_13990 [Pantoea agglomerans]
MNNAKNCTDFRMKLFPLFFTAFFGTGKRYLTQKESNNH